MMTEQKQIYSCEYCDKVFHQKTNFTRHVEALHLGIKYPCLHCDYRASQKTNLDIHIESVHEKKYYQCSLCDYKMHSRFNLARHMRRNHRESQRISIKKGGVSKKPFKSEKKLKFHLKSQNVKNKIALQNNRPQNANALYVCKECGKEFSQRPNLNRHNRAVHLGLKHKCNLCDYEATQLSNLEAHKFRRHEDRLYSCSSCDFTSKTKGDVRRHRDEQHPQYSQKPTIERIKENQTEDVSQMETEEEEEEEVIIEFSLESSLQYCDLCLYQTEEENDLTNHLAVTHYEEIVGS